MGKPIIHSARALFLTFLAPEKSKRNSTLHENCTAVVHPERLGQDLQQSGASKPLRNITF
ncbi:MAG: hypothetical protein RL265_141 [Bacteroidota bacterium]